MSDVDFHLMQPPYFQLEEAIDWIELTQIPEGERDGWQSVIESVRLLEEKLLSDDLKAFASLDASPVQPIAACTWTEFNIHFLRSNGKVLWQRDEGDIFGYVVTSQPIAYRSAALKDLSRKANFDVPGLNEPEPGFYRVMSQVVFSEEDIKKHFPSTVKTVRFANSRILPRIQEILQLMATNAEPLHRDPGPYSHGAVAKKIEEYCATHGLEPFHSEVALKRNISRYYEWIGKRP
jgi:hypothetical protein